MSDAVVDVLVIGAGVTGLARLRTSPRRTLALHRRAPSPRGHGDQHAQQRRHPRRPLLSGRDAEGAAVRRGAERLYAFCARTRVPHERCGKLVVARVRAKIGRARSAAALRIGQRRARASRSSSRRSSAAREPHVACHRGAVVARHGRVEAEALVRALLQRAEAARRDPPARTPALPAARTAPDGRSRCALERETIVARTVVNAAGLYADEVSRAARRRVVHHLPVPRRVRRAQAVAASLGQRAWSIRCRTRRVTASASTSPGRPAAPSCSARRSAIRRARTTTKAIGCRSRRSSSRRALLLPEVTLEDLRYGGSGIRPKLHPPDERFADFMIRPDAHQPALIHAAGIDSPGPHCLPGDRRARRRPGRRDVW